MVTTSALVPPTRVLTAQKDHDWVVDQITDLFLTTLIENATGG
jgi:hypothetical protein